MSNLVSKHMKKYPAEQNPIPQFNREVFLNQIGQYIYKDIELGNIMGMYKRAYATYLHNKGKPCEVNPEPLSPDDFSREIRFDDLVDLEFTIANMYSIGFGTLCSTLGKDPIKEIRKEKSKESSL